MKDQLSICERTVLGLLVDGLSLKMVADRRGISIKTADKHRQFGYKKLGIHYLAELFRFAIRNDWPEIRTIIQIKQLPCKSSSTHSPVSARQS